MNEIYLSPTFCFIIDRIADGIFIEAHYLRMYWLTVGGRRIHNAQIARTHQRELQCTWDWCRSKGQRIYISFALPQFFFCRYAKFLLFVNDQYPQVFKLYLFTDQRMGTDNDIDLTFFQLLVGFLFLFGALEAVHIINGTREIF